MKSLSKNNNLYSFIIILIFCFLIRGPFFQIINNDPDENSYLILSKLLAEYDFILYQDIWFDKLPLSALIFEKGYYIFGADFEAYRLTGLLFVFFSAVVTFNISYLVVRKKNLALLASVLSIYIQTMWFGGIGFVTEHIVILFLNLSLFFYLKKIKYNTYLFYLFLCMAALVRQNIVILLFLLLIFENYKKKNFNYFISSFATCILIFFVNFIYLYLNLGLEKTIDYFIIFPLNYAGQFSVLSNFLNLIDNGILYFVNFKNYNYQVLSFSKHFFIFLIFWLPLFVYSFQLIKQKKVDDKINFIFFYILILFFVSCFGWKSEKYLIMVLPFCIYIFVYIFDLNKNKFSKIIYFFIFFLVLSQTSLIYLKKLVTNQSNNYETSNQYMIVEYLKKNSEIETIFVTQDGGLIHYFYDKKLLHKMLNLNYLLNDKITKKIFNMDSEKYINQIFLNKPDAVIRPRAKEHYLNKKDVENIELNLKKNYVLSKTLYGYRIYLINN